MSYTALYRKYRPSTFDDIAGQQHIVQTLTNALSQNRLAHAYLFTGPSGNGKTSVAKLFAKAINCESKDKIICDRCSNCLDTKQNIHPDVVEIDAASNNGVEEIRNLIEKVKYSPLKGKYKIYIIDEVHMLSLGAFNALLKTLEEPPAHVVFILATTEPWKVIPTIISRCQRYDFTRVNEKDIYNNIVKVLKSENIEYDDQAIKLISHLADGGVRNSLSILEQSIAYSPDLVTVKDVRKIYGIVTKEEKLQLLNYVFNEKMSETLNLLDAITNQGNDLERFNIELVNILKESVIYSYSKAPQLLEILSQEEVEGMLKIVNHSQLLEMIDILMEIDASKKNISDLRAYLELGFIKMISIVKIKDTNKEFSKLKETSEGLVIVEKEPKIIYKEKTNPQSMETSQEINVSTLEEKKKNKKTSKVHHKEEKTTSDKNTEDDALNNEVMKLNDEMLLSLLAFADKEKRLNIEPKWKKIVEYCNDIDVAKYAHKLCQSNVLAIGDNYIVVVVEHNHLANDLNSFNNKAGLTNFLEDKLDEKLEVFAITKNQSLQLIEDFKKRALDNTLPEKMEISLAEAKLPKKEDGLVTKAEEVFGKDGFIIEG